MTTLLEKRDPHGWQWRPRAGRQEGGTGFGQLALRRLLLAPEHACGYPEPLSASVSQPAASAVLPGHVGLVFDSLFSTTRRHFAIDECRGAVVYTGDAAQTAFKGAVPLEMVCAVEKVGASLSAHTHTHVHNKAYTTRTRISHHTPQRTRTLHAVE